MQGASEDPVSLSLRYWFPPLPPTFLSLKLRVLSGQRPLHCHPRPNMKSLFPGMTGQWCSRDLPQRQGKEYIGYLPAQVL